jgi:hypothetical protein
MACNQPFDAFLTVKRQTRLCLFSMFLTRCSSCFSFSSRYISMYHSQSHGSEIRFTTDGSEPSPTHGTVGRNVTVYLNTIVKAVAYTPGEGATTASTVIHAPIHPFIHSSMRSVSHLYICPSCIIPLFHSSNIFPSSHSSLSPLVPMPPFYIRSIICIIFKVRTAT